MSSGFLRGQDRRVGRVIRTRVRFLDAYQGTGTIRPSPSADGKCVRSNESQFAHDALRLLKSNEKGGGPWQTRMRRREWVRFRNGRSAALESKFRRWGLAAITWVISKSSR